MRPLPPTPEEITVPMLNSAFTVLTPRECEVLRWILRAKRDSEIAAIIRNSTRTTSTHVCNILSKFSVETRLAAAMEAVRVVICGRPWR
jgi:DNA-binding NarL/FixJ family response regulator